MRNFTYVIAITVVESVKTFSSFSFCPNHIESSITLSQNYLFVKYKNQPSESSAKLKMNDG